MLIDVSLSTVMSGFVVLKCKACIVEQYHEQCNRNNAMDTVASLYVLCLIDIRAVVRMCGMQLHCW